MVTVPRGAPVFLHIPTTCPCSNIFLCLSFLYVSLSLSDLREREKDYLAVGLSWELFQELRSCLAISGAGFGALELALELWRQNQQNNQKH